MSSKNGLKRLLFIPDGIAGQVVKWTDQCSGDKEINPVLFPSPTSLGVIAEYASALVISDGIIHTNGVSSITRALPDWALYGSCQAYDTIEDILCGINIESISDKIWNNAPEKWKDLYNKINSIPKYSLFDTHDRIHNMELEIANYIAWQGFVNIMGSINEEFFFTDIICDTGYLISRSLLEENRPTIKDALERPFASVSMEMGEVQLPLVLAVVVSRIDKPSQFFEELQNMRHEFSKLKKTMLDIEQIISQSDRKNSGKYIRLLRNDLETAVKKASGSLLSTPSSFEKVGGLLTLDPLAAFGSFLSQGLHLSIIDMFRKPEIRLISKWTEECAFDTIRKLRKIFKTSGSDGDWRLVAKVLQLYGSVSWYPFKSTDNTF